MATGPIDRFPRRDRSVGEHGALRSLRQRSQSGGHTSWHRQFHASRQRNPRQRGGDLAAADQIGGPLLNNNYPLGWAMAGNTPLKRFKQNVHGGGVRDPLIVHWPAGIQDQGALRHGFVHATDLYTTVLDLVGLQAPESMAGLAQIPIDGVSFASTFSDEEAVIERGPQIFELFGHRAIVHQGWKAVAWHAPGTDFEDDTWELYRLDGDFSEYEDLAEEEEERLSVLKDLWWSEADAIRCFPWTTRLQRTMGTERRSRKRTTEFEYWPAWPTSHGCRSRYPQSLLHRSRRKSNWTKRETGSYRPWRSLQWVEPLHEVRPPDA